MLSKKEGGVSDGVCVGGVRLILMGYLDRYKVLRVYEYAQSSLKRDLLHKLIYT